MLKLKVLIILALLFSGCVISTRPVQSPRYYSIEPPRHYYWYTYPYHHPTHTPHYYHNHHNSHHNPRPHHNGPRR